MTLNLQNRTVMKRKMLLAWILLSSCHLFAQVNVRMKVRITDTLVIDKFEPRTDFFAYQFLEMNPGGFRITNEKMAERLKSETIVGVDLVYSDYPEGEDFTALNERRLIELFGALPQAFNRPVVSWRVVKQTGVKKTGNIHNYFHGFAIYYREMPSFYAENKLIEQIVNGEVAPGDSNILKIFERNGKWKDMLVVCDVTGSMSPYTAQILLWIKANQKLRNMKDIVFFNDDEEKSTNQVQTEDQTGLWSVSSGDYKKVMNVAVEAMQKGNHIENNLEAVCSAIKKFPDGQGKVIMIADNWEEPCDQELVNYLIAQKIPLRIILCGVNASINTYYFDLARATGGSLHTIESDFENLASLKPGTKLKIGDLEVILTPTGFIQKH